MTFFFSSLLLVAGFITLIKGADFLVEGASSLARRLGMSNLMIGLTIVAFGTSMPELLVNIIASAQGNTDIAVGNIIGSNIANTLLVLGAASLIAPLTVQTSTVWKEIPLSLLATLVLFVLLNDVLLDGTALSILTRSDGIILIAFFLIFLYYTFGMKKLEDGHSKMVHSLPMAIGFVLLGMFLLPLGGKLVVDASLAIARLLGVSEAFIALSLVALGTSLPEVVTSCIAVRKGKLDIAVGNVIGSNIFNVLWILGISAIIRPLIFSVHLNIDLFIALVSSLLLLILIQKGTIVKRFFVWRHRDQYFLVKHEGILLLLSYVAYLVFIGVRG
jgi:cation:H+ antiporter